MEEMLVYTLIYIFILKVLDSTFINAKMEFLTQNKFFYSSLCNGVSSMLIIMTADAMANSSIQYKPMIVVTIFIATMLGGYALPKLVDKLSKDRLFVFNITADDFDNGKEFADKLRGMDITTATTVTYNVNMDKSLYIKAYSVDKEISKTIVDVLKQQPNFKWHITEAL